MLLKKKSLEIFIVYSACNPAVVVLTRGKNYDSRVTSRHSLVSICHKTLNRLGKKNITYEKYHEGLSATLVSRGIKLPLTK